MSCAIRCHWEKFQNYALTYGAFSRCIPFAWYIYRWNILGSDYGVNGNTVFREKTPSRWCPGKNRYTSVTNNISCCVHTIHSIGFSYFVCHKVSNRTDKSIHYFPFSLFFLVPLDSWRRTLNGPAISAHNKWCDARHTGTRGLHVGGHTHTTSSYAASKSIYRKCMNLSMYDWMIKI